MDKKNSTILLTATCIQRIIQEVGLDEIMDQLIERTYFAFSEFDDKNTLIPIRSGFNYKEPAEGLIEWMPLRNIKKDEVLVKMVGYHPQNPTRYQLPTIISTIAKYDTNTGHLKALIDGVLPTALRTGAASAVATKVLANSESNVLGLIGCGAQAVTQLHALSRVYTLKEVLYFDTDPSAVESFQDRVDVLGLKNIEFKHLDINEIVAQADIVCTATSIGVGEGPLFDYSNSKTWLHVNAVGSDFEGKIELPKDLLLQSYVVPDLLEQAVIEGECQQLEPDQIGENIISVIKSTNQLQYLKEQLTVFDSTGIPLEDEVAANLFLDYASDLGIGETVFLENTMIEEKNPYSFMMNLKHK